MRRNEVIPFCIGRQIHQRPVIQPGALEVAILERVAERADQMKAQFGRGRQARNRAGILRNLGADQDDVQDGRPNP